MRDRFSQFLTVLSVIFVIIIIGMLLYWIYDLYTQYKIDLEAKEAIKIFNNQISIAQENQNNPDDIDIDTEEIEETETIENPEENIEETIETGEQLSEEQNNTSVSSSSNNGTKTSTTTKKNTNSTYNKYQNYTILGYIEIPKTKVNYPILAENSASALNLAISKLYGVGLNKIGNTVLIGHNNNNGRFFANNKKLNVGDVIYITDAEGVKIAYTIYNKYETNENDASYMNRDTNGLREISLSTCTNRKENRLIILARAE